MDAASTLTRHWPRPGSGTSTSASFSPGPASGLISAFIRFFNDPSALPSKCRPAPSYARRDAPGAPAAALHPYCTRFSSWEAVISWPAPGAAKEPGRGSFDGDFGAQRHVHDRPGAAVAQRNLQRARGAFGDEQAPSRRLRVRPHEGQRAPVAFDDDVVAVFSDVRQVGDDVAEAVHPHDFAFAPLLVETQPGLDLRRRPQLV